MKYWSIPRLFVGGTVAILASGPSMSKAVADQVRAAGIPAIAINSTYRLAPWAWMVYAADAAWWKHPTNQDVFDIEAMRVSIWTGEMLQGVSFLRRSNDWHIPAQADCVTTLGHSGGQAIQIAAKTGATRILLCGYDMRVTSEACHWHGEHPAGLRKTDPDLYPSWIERIGKVAPQLEAAGVEVINCTPDSALKCFPSMRLDEALGK